MQRLHSTGSLEVGIGHEIRLHPALQGAAPTGCTVMDRDETLGCLYDQAAGALECP